MSSGPEKSIRPFVFEHSFDILATPEELEIIKQKEEEEAAPVFSEEELQTAREESYKQGLQAGLQEATTGIDQQVATTLEVLGSTLDRLTEQQQQANELIARETIELAVAAVAKLLPEFIQSCGATEIENFVGNIMSRILEEPRITIRVADEIVPEIERNLIDLAGRIGFGGTLAVTGDSDLGIADCRIRWSDGDAERIIESTLKEIEALSQAVPRHVPTSTLEISAEPPASPQGDSVESEMMVEAEAETAPETVEAEVVETEVAVPAEPESLNVSEEEAAHIDAAPQATDQMIELPETTETAEPVGDLNGEDVDVPHSNLEQKETTDDVPETPLNSEPT